MSEHVCPCCGSPLPDDISWSMATRTFIAAGKSVRLTGTQAEIVDAIWQGGGVHSLERLAAKAYAGNVDGGPDTLNVVSVHLANIRRRIEPMGWTISKNMGQPRTGYRVVKMVAEQAVAG